MSIFDLFSKIEVQKQPLSTGVEFLVVGLGNPDAKYQNTRHNAGFMAIDAIAKKHSVFGQKEDFEAQVCRVHLKEHSCLLMKPLTYMNLSGRSVVAAMQFYKISPERVIVLYDDILLDVGELRIRRKGSDGGQNGIKNIIYLSGSENFPRIKIGAGKKPHPGYDLTSWVLSKFTPEELVRLEEALEKATLAVEMMVSGDIASAMNAFNRRSALDQDSLV